MNHKKINIVYVSDATKQRNKSYFLASEFVPTVHSFKRFILTERVPKLNERCGGYLPSCDRIHEIFRALSTLRGLRGAPEVPPLCRETKSLGQQMLNATVGINGLIPCNIIIHATCQDPHAQK